MRATFDSEAQALAIDLVDEPRAQVADEVSSDKLCNVALDAADRPVSVEILYPEPGWGGVPPSPRGALWAGRGRPAGSRPRGDRRSEPDHHARGRELERMSEAEDYSGRIGLRMPRTLHAELAAAAEREGVSLNSFIVSALAAAVAWRVAGAAGTPERRPTPKGSQPHQSGAR